MSEYTESFAINAETLDIDEEKMLYDNAKEFRGFDKALIAFLLEHGFTGDSTDIKSMTKFVRTKFREAEVPELHNFKDLFNPNKGNNRETAFKICFAFHLNIQETNDFFKRVMFERGIDCHAINEAVYYFGLKNGLSYLEAESIIAQCPKVKNSKKIPDRDILYTDKIIDYIESISEKEHLLRYIKENIDSFEYNKASAIKFINSFWEKIIGPEGLAFKEGKLLNEMLNPLHPDRTKKPEKDTRCKEVIEEEIAREEELKKDDFVISMEEASTWTIYCQIMGLDNQQESRHAQKRSLSPIFTNNVLLPLKASYCFPSQQTIDSIIRGESEGDYEKFRKMLIFLAFYTFWVKIVIEKKDIFYCSNYYDGDRCKNNINKYLVDAGYPELYPGNPYDWIFLWSMNDEQPLNIFRAYMREVYIAKTQDTEQLY